MADDASPHAILAWKYRCAQNNVLLKNIEFITQAIKDLQQYFCVSPLLQ